MKFTIHSTESEQAVGYVYAESHREALEVALTWEGLEQPAEVVDDEEMQAPALVAGDTIYYAREVEGVAPLRPATDGIAEAVETLKKLETDSDEFMDLVETSWWEFMQGELLLTREAPTDPYDAAARDLVERLGGYAVESILTMRDAVEQFDRNGNVVPGGVISPDELAHRITLAIATVLYGEGEKTQEVN